MAFTKLANGHLIPLPEDRIAFAREVSIFVQLAIFRGQREVRAKIGGRIATLTIPHETEILNFLTLTETGDPGVIDVHLQLPVIMEEQRYAFEMCVRYSPLLDGKPDANSQNPPVAREKRESHPDRGEIDGGKGGSTMSDQ